MAKKGNTMAPKEKRSSDDETKDTPDVTDRGKGTPGQVNERKGCACIKVICRYGIPLIVLALGVLIATNPALIARWTSSFAPVSNKVTKYIRDKVTGKDGSKVDWQENLDKNGKSFRVLTDKQIQYRKGGKLRLVVAGHVFDVSEAASMYGEGSGYHGFIGRDGTRAFVSGKFDEEGLIPDLGGLDSDELKGISTWIDFYLNHETYKFIGLHEGWFFDAAGRPTENMLKFREGLIEADKKREIDAEFENQFPSCNSEWTAQSGSRVWCSQMSGGISRDWVGYPRIFNQEDKPSRCACVRELDSKDKRIELYKGCARNSNECKFKE